MAPSGLRFGLSFPTKGFPSGVWAWSRRHAAAPAHPTACSLGAGIVQARWQSLPPPPPPPPTVRLCRPARLSHPPPAVPPLASRAYPAGQMQRAGRPRRASAPGPGAPCSAPPLRRGHRLRPRPRLAPPGRRDPSQERTQVLRLLRSTGCHGDRSARSGQVALGARQPGIHTRPCDLSTWPHTQEKKKPSKSSHQSCSHHEMALALYVALQAQTLTATKVILLSCFKQTSGPRPAEEAGHRGGAKYPASRNYTSRPGLSSSSQGHTH